jgi:hypothetical protein
MFVQSSLFFLVVDLRGGGPQPVENTGSSCCFKYRANIELNWSYYKLSGKVVYYLAL